MAVASAGPYASCTSLQTDNHASTIPLLSFLQAGCPSCRPTNSVKALKAKALKANDITKRKKKLSTYVVFTEKHGQLLHRNSEVCLVKFVRYVPTERTELASLLDQSMKEAETEQHPLPCSLNIPTQPNVSFTRSQLINTHTHTHTCLTALFPGLPGWASTGARDSEW